MICPLTGSVDRRYGKYRAPFWLIGKVVPPTPAFIQASIGAGGVVVPTTAGACGGGSTIAKARLRSAKASAALITALSVLPGTIRRLKISTLSSEELAANTGRKSPSS
jgi:hypothetical protein